jgi:ribosomal protein S18 acetylase RimI-like enzyme
MDDGILRLSAADAEAIASVVNEAATTYDGTIPEDCYSEPYLSVDDLCAELETTEFYGYEMDGDSTDRSGGSTDHSETSTDHPEASTGHPEASTGHPGNATTTLAGVVGFQERDDASLIRRLYVRPEFHGERIGSRLLQFALGRVSTDPILVGTWRDAERAVAFYETNGFTNLGTDRELLRTYWDHSERRNGESVVLRYDQ